jgi:hypothetical protein
MLGGMVRLLWFVLALTGLVALLAPGCSAEEDCATGIDEDGDGLAGCADPECWVVGGICVESCPSDHDEDGDGLAGCADPDCWAVGICPERCDGASDADGDGLLGCADPDCWLAGAGCAEICDGGHDEDGDGDVDCDDDDCWGAGHCPEQCAGVEDEDGDGLVDCDDPDCVDDVACAPTYAEEVRPILLEHCAGASGACHSADSALGGLSVESYADLPKPSIYCPGETKGWCSLFRVLEPTMPQDCIGCVLPAQIEILERWVDAGIPP